MINIKLHIYIYIYIYKLPPSAGYHTLRQVLYGSGLAVAAHAIFVEVSTRIDAALVAAPAPPSLPLMSVCFPRTHERDVATGRFPLLPVLFVLFTQVGW
jgi:hypothetical protein